MSRLTDQLLTLSRRERAWNTSLRLRWISTPLWAWFNLWWRSPCASSNLRSGKYVQLETCTTEERHRDPVSFEPCPLWRACSSSAGDGRGEDIRFAA